MLKKLSEIFENEEIKKLCGESDDNENNGADNDNENENENENKENEADDRSSQASLSRVKKNESIVSLVTLENLRESLINENKQDYFSNHDKLKNLYNNTRLKSLDESIQSIKEFDL